MTAQPRTGRADQVDVALGTRSYDIVIGRGQLALLGQRIAALRPGAKTAIVSDETVARHHLAAAQASLASAGIGVTVRDRPARGELEELFSARESLRGADRRAHRACRPGGGPGRRCDWRSRRLRGRGGSPRSRLRAGPHHSAGAGQFIGRRQDRDRFQRTARISSARSISRCWWSPIPRFSTRSRCASSARVMPRSSNTGCSGMPPSSLGSRRTGGTCSRAALPASTPSR